MKPIITLHNLPKIISDPLLKRILSGNRVEWKDFLLCPSETDSANSIDAHIVLKKKSDVKFALRKLNQCEVSDRIVEVKAVTDAIAEIVESKLNGKAKQPQEIQRQENKSSVDESLFTDKSAVTKTPEKPRKTVIEIERVPFSQLNLSPQVLSNLERLGFETATPIQSMAIPPVLEGRDMIGRAQTGTGKTLAFSLPMVERFLAKPGKGIRGLIVAPTRELAVQIKEVIDGIVVGTDLKVAVVYGGDSILDQMIELKEGVNILIATPGRLLDLQGRGFIRFDAAEVFVLDEADRMMDMGFLPSIKTIYQCFYEHPQTLLFSATIPQEIRKLTGIQLHDPAIIDVGAPDLTPLDAVAQNILYVNHGDKHNHLTKLLDKEDGSILVFARTRRSTEKLARKLKNDGFLVARIHGDIEQSDRLKAVEAFRNGKVKILVATDVASRGLDIDGIAHVVNYDLPMAPEDHLHRIGRTARAGATGKATTFVTPEDKRSVKNFKVVFGKQ